jgi:uncharacterized RDD family membrane protein YckC
MSDSTPTPPPEGGGFEPPPPPPPPPASDPGAAGGQPGGYPGGQPQQPGGPPPGGYAPAPGYGPPPTGGVGQPADLLMRFLARFIDGILIGIVYAIISSILLVSIIGLNGGGGFGFGMGGGYAYAAINGVIGAVIYLGYFAGLESRNGQTVGKMLLKLQTQGPDGGTPTLEESVKRNFWVALGVLAVIPVIGSLIGSLAELAIVIVIAVTISNSPTKQGWHDGIAGGTRVIKIG